MAPRAKTPVHPAVDVSHRPRLVAFPCGALLVLSAQGTIRPWLTVAVSAIALGWPWLVRWLSVRSKDSGRAAYRGMLFDALLVGLFAGLVSFRPVPTIALVLVIATLNMTMGGVRFFLQTLGMTLGGALLSLAFVQPDFGAPTSTATMVYSALLIIIACWYTAYLVNDTTRRFIATRRDLRLRNEELEQLNRIARMVNATLDLGEVMKAAMTALQRLFSFDQFGIFMIDAERGVLVADRQMGSGFRPELITELGAIEVPLDDEASLFASVVRNRKHVFIPRFTFAQVAGLAPADRRLYELSPVKGLMLFPLEIQGEVLGVIAFGNTRAPFEADERLLEVIARYVTQIVTAIHNARLFDSAEKARAAALEADRSKSSFLANISQELRRPLNAIVGHTELLRRQPDDAVSPPERLNRIHESGQRLRALVDDVLEISRLETGQRPLVAAEVVVRDLAHEAASAVLPISRRRNVTVTADVEPDAGSIETDRATTRRVLTGVLSTAVEMAEGGAVRLHASRNGKADGGVRFAIHVDSSGLSREATARLFDDFRDASEEGTEGIGGGGLAVARRFCRLMGGDVTVRSQMGRGSTFSVELPARIAARAVSREARTPPALAPAADEEDGDDEAVGGRVVSGSHYTDEELLSRLQTNELAGVLAGSALTVLAATIEVRHCSPGEVIADQGQRASRMFLLLEGRARILAQYGGTSFETLEEIESGAVFGEIAFIAGGRRPARIEALDDCWVGCLRHADVERLVDEDPGLAVRLSNVATRRLLAAQLPEHLRAAFGDLEHDVLLVLIQEAERVVLRSGETLFHEGDPAEAIFIVLNGRLQVEVSREGVLHVLGEVGRGETVGEMALVTGGQRSATVVALRDTELASLPRSTFERLMLDHPRAAFALTRLLAKRLGRAAASSGHPERPRSTTFALVAVTPDVPIEECARHFESALADFGATLRVDPARAASALGRRDIAYVGDHEPGHVRLTQWFAEMEASQRFVVYQADPTWTPWTHRAIRQADRILLIARSDRDPATAEVEQRIRLSWRDDRAPRADLLMLHSAGTDEPAGTARWLEQRSVDRHFHVRRGSAADFARVARILTGNALGMVLGGGGARAFAHIGVIRALEQLSVPVDLIAGTSFGAAVAACYAIGNDSAGLAKMAQENFSRSFIDLTFPAYALLRGSGIMEICARAFGDRMIEDLWMPFFCISTNLSKAEVVVHRQGPLSRSVRSSLAIPGVVPAVVEGEDLLVDGGLLNNVPVDVMRSLVGSGRVLAVDVSTGSRLRAQHDPGLEVSGWKLLREQLRPGGGRRLPTIGAVLNRVTIVESTRSRARLMQQADAYITLPLRGFGMMDFQEFVPLIEQGYDGSIAQLRQWLEANAVAAPQSARTGTA